jgi:HAD superfamily hydrolase (TIGR01490 family)
MSTARPAEVASAAAKVDAPTPPLPPRTPTTLATRRAKPDPATRDTNSRALWTNHRAVDGWFDRTRSIPFRILGWVPSTAAFFDLDKTIIAKSSVLAFGKPFYQGGLINRRAVLRSAYAQFVFALAGADEDQIERMRAYLTSMCTGWDVAQVREIVSETLHEIIDPIVYDEAVELIGLHKAAGREVVIVSSSGEEVVAPIGAMLGADHVIGTEMVVAEGKYTGEIGRYAYGPAKASAIRELAVERGYDLSACYAYSDSATDVPMLEAVGHPFAVNPDRALRRIAGERDWPTLTFSNAVPLRERISGLRPDHPTLTATAVGAGIAVGGLLWYATRRRVDRA